MFHKEIQVNLEVKENLAVYQKSVWAFFQVPLQLIPVINLVSSSGPCRKTAFAKRISQEMG